MRSVTVRLEDELDELLGNLARETGRTKSYTRNWPCRNFSMSKKIVCLG